MLSLRVPSFAAVKVWRQALCPDASVISATTCVADSRETGQQSYKLSPDLARHYAVWSCVCHAESIVNGGEHILEHPCQQQGPFVDKHTLTGLLQRRTFAHSGPHCWKRSLTTLQRCFHVARGHMCYLVLLVRTRRETLPTGSALRQHWRARVIC